MSYTLETFVGYVFVYLFTSSNTPNSALDGLLNFQLNCGVIGYSKGKRLLRKTK